MELVIEKIGQPFIKFLGNKYRLVHHILFWMVFLSDEFLSFLGVTDPIEEPYLHILGVSSLMIMVYMNLYLFIPFLLFKGRAWIYIVVTIISIIAQMYLYEFIYHFSSFGFEFNPTGFVISTLNNFYLLGTAIGLKLFKIWIQNQKRMKALENENLKSELSYLKSQVNPHFLFNSLNNIYVQTKIDQKEAAKSILNLSDLLRYQLYDCSKEKVLLSSEIEYLNNFLSLDRLRKKDATIEFKVNGNPNGITIPPLLFIPFIENAVKYGLSEETGSFIRSSITISPNSIDFYIENSKRVIHVKKDEGGLGLTNIKRRLELLFPEQYVLKIEDNNDTFIVDLRIQLK